MGAVEGVFHQFIPSRLLKGKEWLFVSPGTGPPLCARAPSCGCALCLAHLEFPTTSISWNGREIRIQPPVQPCLRLRLLLLLGQRAYEPDPPGAITERADNLPATFTIYTSDSFSRDDERWCLILSASARQSRRR